MADWITTANGIITLVTGLIGLIGTGVGAFFAIKNWIKLLKEKNFNEIWKMIMEITDAAMKEVESSLLSGEDKKKIVIDTVKASCKAAGIDISLFVDQLADYIDQTITFVNGMKKASTK